MDKVYSPVTIENIPGRDIPSSNSWRNFAGNPDKFNRDGGKRYFHIFLDSGFAKELESDGWNIKWLQPIDEGDDPQAVIKVNVRFGPRPPKIVIVKERGEGIPPILTPITEDTVHTLDWAEIEKADVILSPYNWENARGESGVSAYLKTLYITTVRDRLAEKYENYDEALDGGDY